MADWESEQQPHRRFAKRSQRSNKGAAKRGGGSFQPRNMLGRYTIRSSNLEKLATAASKDKMWLEIHELVHSETGYLATFEFGVINGVMLIAGSRKGLQRVIQEVEEQDEESVDNSSGDNQEEQEHLSETSMDGEDGTQRAATDIDVQSFITVPDLERPSHAFEKNTFRTPKWFAQWRGRILNASIHETNGMSNKLEVSSNEQLGSLNPYTNPENRAHFEFSSSACRDFEATFTCHALNLKDVPLQGWKITGKATPAKFSWNDLDPLHSGD